MLAAGAVAAGISTIAKWLIVGPIRAGEQPLWSSFVWRTEVSDTFTEMVAAPWFARAAAGTPALAVWLRSLGAKIGRGVWCDSYWLPEPDLVTLGDGATVNRGCVVQTHLFHDRIMSMDTVELEAGATLGPHSVILPAATHRRARDRRPRVAGDARRDRARRLALERQPDRPVARGQGPRVPVDIVSGRPVHARRAATHLRRRVLRARPRLPGAHQPAEGPRRRQRGRGASATSSCRST